MNQLIITVIFLRNINIYLVSRSLKILKRICFSFLRNIRSVI